ncbi:Dienelactone hydrolase family [Musa troglodytarum]|uniref:Dienelactone hydrolase family n=1 Tax=Musa troglodytarum TaxID=320322 RepID=A0A9E7H9Z2_9LILI|nr:Dienelactone hydrolase family [Musa troglodytarum]
MAAAPPPSKRLRTNQSEGGAAEGSPGKEGAPLVVLAHGAGAPSTSEWMLRWKEKLGEELDAVEVVTFDYPYISGGKRKAPPKAEKLVDHHLDVVKRAIKEYPGHPLILVGKSMGSRVSCMVAGEEDINVAAIVCLGYPLKGSKDSLCPLDKLESTRKKMKCANELHVIDGGDHSFKIGKKHQQSTGIDQDEAEGRALKAIADFVNRSVLEQR